MTHRTSVSRGPGLGLTPLSIGIATILGLVCPSANATLFPVVYVNNCDQNTTSTDYSHGSLRYAVSAVEDGGTIDMTGLTCSTISLQGSGITIWQNDLTILGPGQNSLTVTGKYTQNNTSYLMRDRLFTHTGTGTLKMYDVTLERGYYKNSSAPAAGGCILSSGNVYLDRVKVHYCIVTTDSSVASGGGIAAATGTVTLQDSQVSSNVAAGGVAGSSEGGGIAAKIVNSTASLIQYNDANHGNGGGIYALYGSIDHSTISNNTASYVAGGARFVQSTSPSKYGINSVTLTNSTVSYNSAGMVGGVYTNQIALNIAYSTIAANTASFGSKSTTNKYNVTRYYSPGVATMPGMLVRNISIQMNGSLLSNNTYGTNATEDDLSTYSGTRGFYSYTTVFNSGPAHNLVRAAKATGMPSDTLIGGGCPGLGTLRDNGGPTPTMALLSQSPAIDAGGTTGPVDDQRYYPRPDQSHNDIGAFEMQQLDSIFSAGFDGCPSLP